MNVGMREETKTEKKENNNIKRVETVNVKKSTTKKGCCEIKEVCFVEKCSVGVLNFHRK